MWSYFLIPLLFVASYQGISVENHVLVNLNKLGLMTENDLNFLTKHVYWPILSLLIRVSLSFWLSYLPTFIQTSRWASRDGCVWPTIQHLSIWRTMMQWFPGSVHLETPLNHQQQYVFAAFPHGPATCNHFLTMTDSVQFLSKHYQGERRDLVASVLMYIPILKELLLFLGCVDASAHTAHYNMKKGRSILIFVGGEKEQLLSMNHEHKVYLKTRKGFVKLALQYGAHLVPMYCFGENECYTSSKMFMGKLQFVSI
jgi:hypothetical protein